MRPPGRHRSGRLGPSSDRLSALWVIVSELVTNSVKYGPGGPIRLSVNVSEDGAVLGRIEDGGQGQVMIVRTSIQQTVGWA